MEVTMSQDNPTTMADQITDALTVIGVHIEHAERDLVDMLTDLKTEPEWSALTPELEELLAEIHASSERVTRLIRDNSATDIIRRL